VFKGCVYWFKNVVTCVEMLIILCIVMCIEINHKSYTLNPKPGFERKTETPRSPAGSSASAPTAILQNAWGTGGEDGRAEGAGAGREGGGAARYGRLMDVDDLVSMPCQVRV
jgi:hypothetical protein